MGTNPSRKHPQPRIAQEVEALTTWSRPGTRAGRIRDVVAAVAAAVLGSVVIAVLLRAVHVHFSLASRIALSEVLPALAVGALVSKWGWWNRVGWRWPTWRSIWLLCLPVALLVISLLSSRAPSLYTQPAVATGVAVLLVGFTEEMWFRGVVLELVIPRGALVATVYRPGCSRHCIS